MAGPQPCCLILKRHTEGGAFVLVSEIFVSPVRLCLNTMTVSRMMLLPVPGPRWTNTGSRCINLQLSCDDDSSGEYNHASLFLLCSEACSICCIYLTVKCAWKLRRDSNKAYVNVCSQQFIEFMLLIQKYLSLNGCAFVRVREWLKK